MVNRIIADYLKAGKRLVIPQFGAFIHKDTDGGVVFVPFLKKDDGVLATQLSTTYGLSNEEAYGVIAEYIAQVQRSVADRGSFVVEGVGRLRIDSNGVCYLEADNRAGAGDIQPQSASMPKPVVQTPAQPSARQSASAPVATAQSPAVQNASAQPVRTQPVPAQCPPPVQQRTAAPSSQQSPQSPRFQQPQQPRSAMPGQRPVQPSGNIPPSPAAYQQPVQQGGRPQPGYPQSQGQPAQPQQPVQSPVPHLGQQPYGGAPQYAPQGVGRPVSPHPVGAGMPVQQKGTDKFLVVAILAAVIALGAIIYGVITSSAGTPKIDPMELPSHQRPAVLDSIQKQDSIQAAEEAAKAAKTASKPKR